SLFALVKDSGWDVGSLKTACRDLLGQWVRSGALPGRTEHAQEGGEVMQRSEKKEMIDSLRAKMEKAAIAIALEYKNISAAATVVLRKKFRDSKVDYKVVKNTLAKLAAKGTSLEPL